MKKGELNPIGKEAKLNHLEFIQGVINCPLSNFIVQAQADTDGPNPRGFLSCPRRLPE